MMQILKWLFVLTFIRLTFSSGKKNVVLLISKCDLQFSKPENAMGMIMSDTLNRENWLFELHEIDVCDMRVELRKALISMLLHPKWYDSNNKTIISAVLAYMPDDMLKITTAVLSMDNIYVLPLTKTPFDDWFRQSYGNYIPVVDLQNEAVVTDILHSWKDLQYVTIIEIFEHQPYFNVRDIVRDNPIVCVNYHHLNVNDLKTESLVFTKLTHLLKTDQTAVVFLIGTGTARLFMMTAYAKHNINDKFWILLDKEAGKRKENDVHSNRPHYVAINNTVPTYSNQKFPIKYDNKSICSHAYQAFLRQIKNDNKTTNLAFLGKTECKLDNAGYLSDEDKQIKQQYIYAFTVFIGRRLLSLAKVLLNPKVPPALATMQWVQFQGNKTIIKNSFDGVIQQSGRIKNVSRLSCPPCPTCDDMCKERTVRQTSTSYNQSYGYACSICRSDMVSGDDNGQCKKCNGREIPNTNQTKCYDPYVNENIFLVCYAVNGMGLMLCVCVLIIYTKYRTTPVVRSSNYFLTIIQLSLVTALFTALPPLMLTELTPFLCTLRPCILGVLLTGSVSVVVCKAEKVLTIFHTKARLSKKDIFEIGVRQMFVLGILVTINLIIIPATITIPDTTSKLLYHTVHNDPYYIMYCSSEDKFYLQIVYCVIILILGIMQGYRGRKLPTNYNEGNSIVVAAATTSVAFAFTIWFQHSKKYAHERKSTCWLCLSISLIFLIVSLYAPKLYVMLLQPEKNTKEYRLNLMLIDSNKGIERDMFYKRKRSYSHTKLMEELANVRERAASMAGEVMSRRQSYDVLKDKTLV